MLKKRASIFSRQGFTLIELLLVIAIIGILASIVLMVVSGAKSQARNAARLADVRQFANVLELYVSDTGHYPVSATTTECAHTGNWIPDGTNYNWSAPYLAVQPRDPGENCAQNPPQAYSYQSDGNTYTITIPLEGTPASPAGSDITFNGSSFTPTAVQFTVSLATSAGNPTDQPIPVTATFSLPVSDFTPSSISGTNVGLVTQFTEVMQNVYTFLVTPSSDGAVVVQLLEDIVHAVTGQGNPSAQLNETYDTQAPHLSLSPNPLPQSVSAAFVVEMNSTIPVSDFSDSSVSATDAVVSNAQEVPPLNGENYSFTVTPGAPGIVTVMIPAGAAHSSAGNGNVPSNTLTTQYQ